MPFKIYIVSLALSIVISFIATPLVGIAAIRYRAIDKPSGRKIHRKEIPLWGGIAIFSGVFFSLAILKSIFPEVHQMLSASDGSLMHTVEGITAGAVFIMLIGIVDDLKGIRPTTKLLGQIITALIIMQYGIKISGIKIPLLNEYWNFPVYLSILVTSFWIVLFTNSINLIDGIDGLATGVMFIAAAVFAIINHLQISVQSDPANIEKLKLAAILCTLLGGSCLGFLKFNFPPAKIFLGDSGSLLLGYFAGVIAVTGIIKTAATFTLILPLIILGFPIFDTFISTLRRLLSSKSFMEADRDHIHHKLLYRKGATPTKVLMRLYMVTAVLGFIAIMVSML